MEQYPTLIGENGSGIVQKVGDGASHLLAGDRVTFQSALGTKYGTFQYCLAVAELASEVPDNISFDEAAPIAVCFNSFAVVTYAQHPQGIGLTPPFEAEGVGKYADRPILITGGACSLGQYAIQLANLSGFSPIMTTASLKNKALFLLSLGARHRGTIAGAPLTSMFDAISLKETQQMTYDLLAPAGTLAIVNQKSVEEDEASQKKVLMVHETFHAPENRKLGAKYATASTKWLAEGKIKPNPVEVLSGGLNGIADGLKRLEAGRVNARKLIVRISETRA